MFTNDVNKKIKTLISILTILIFVIPILSIAADEIVPCGGHIFNEKGEIIGEQPACGYDQLILLVKNIINWIIKISSPIAAGVFAWAGIKYMISGASPSQKSEAKEMMRKVLIGFILILSAWLIVTSILNVILNKSLIDSNFPVEGVSGV